MEKLAAAHAVCNTEIYHVVVDFMTQYVLSLKDTFSSVVLPNIPPLLRTVGHENLWPCCYPGQPEGARSYQGTQRKGRQGEAGEPSDFVSGWIPIAGS